ncbi:MAG: hypothetical protein OXI94_07995 [Gemmatimonadota bacterium]|nr:hypothetical protein [Gemmatimonadota bacterium]
MQQEKERQEEVDELYRILAEESKEFQEYLDILETLPQEPLFPPVSVESGNTTSHTPNGELEHA